MAVEFIYDLQENKITPEEDHDSLGHSFAVRYWNPSDGVKHVTIGFGFRDKKYFLAGEWNRILRNIRDGNGEAYELAVDRVSMDSYGSEIERLISTIENKEISEFD